MGVERVHRSSIESTILICIFVILLAFLGMLLSKERRISREQNLYHELFSMRQGINLFQMTIKRHPVNLIELLTEVYEMPGDTAKYRYVDKIKYDALGRIIDPFGNPYEYDQTKGWVKSTTEPYTGW